MEEARVEGTVVATTCVPSLRSRKLLLIQPLDGAGAASGTPLVALDTTSAGPGTTVFFVRGREAAEALDDPFCPADAAILGIVDMSRRAPGREPGH